MLKNYGLLSLAVARAGRAPDGGDPHRVPLARPPIRGSARRRRGVVVEPRASPRHRRRDDGGCRRPDGSATAPSDAFMESAGRAVATLVRDGRTDPGGAARDRRGRRRRADPTAAPGPDGLPRGNASGDRRVAPRDRGRARSPCASCIGARRCWPAERSPRSPHRAGDLIAELASAVRSTPLGGPLAPSPAVGALGALSVVAFGDPSHSCRRPILLAGPPLAAILMYRAAVRLSVRPGPAVVAAAAYGLGALTLWSFSEGRLGLSIALAVLAGGRGARRDRVRPRGAAWRPAAVRRGIGGHARRRHRAYPGIMLAIATLVALRVGLGPRPLRGLLLIRSAAIGAAVLLFPFVPDVAGRRRDARSDLPRRHDRAGPSRAAGARARARARGRSRRSSRSGRPWASASSVAHSVARPRGPRSPRAPA